MCSEEQMVDFFRKADTDGSNFLSRDEVKAVFKSNGYNLSEEDFNAVFQKFDSSGDGKVSLDEFLDIMRQQKPVRHKGAAMRRVFKMWDKDGNGTIDKGELKQVFEEMGKHFSEAELQRMIELMDADGSGSVDYEEFTKHVFGVEA